MNIIALSGAMIVSLASTCLAGSYFTTEVRVEAEDSGTGAGAKGGSKLKTWSSGGDSKTDFVESTNPAMPAGTSLLVKDGGKAEFVINPRDKIYLRFDPRAYTAGWIARAKSATGIRFADFKMKKQLEEDGPQIAGVPTRHYRYHTSYTTASKLKGRGKMRTSVEEDLWLTRSVTDVTFGSYRQLATGFADYDQQIRAEVKKAKGFPMKKVTTMTTTDQTGKTTNTRVTMEVTEYKTMEVPASTFELPAGYREGKLAPPGKYE